MNTAREAAARLGSIGVWSFELERMTAADEGRLALEVESLGFKALWIPESLGSKEVFAHAGILLAATKTLIVASGIANIWARDPVAMANGARTLQEAYADRFLCGIGVSHKPTIDARLGGGYERPLSRMRDYLDGMDKAPYVGPNRKDPPPPRVLAALGPRHRWGGRTHGRSRGVWRWTTRSDRSAPTPTSFRSSTPRSPGRSSVPIRSWRSSRPARSSPTRRAAARSRAGT